MRKSMVVGQPARGGASGVAAQATPDAPPLAGCPTTMLLRMGSELPALFANGVPAFPTPPAAPFVGIVDEGGRPEPLSACPDTIGLLASDLAAWLFNVAAPVPRIRSPIAWI